ncbi:hypothetical protein PU560_03345, partial [Georgenia sp. 10Sc9-8]|nr:hypothetical protein [Georgenia halotolerans]
ALRKALRRGLRGGERRLLRRFGRIASLPWAIATGEDRRYLADPAPTTPTVGVLAWWTRELWRLSGHGDRLAHGTIARVYHLVAAPWLLVRPRLVWHVLHARLRGYGPPSPPPRVLADGDGHLTDPPG